MRLRMVRAGCAKDMDHARQRRFAARAHVQRIDGQPHGRNADNRSSSRIQAAQSPAAAVGQVIVMFVEPRRSSMRMSDCTARVGAGRATGTNEATGNGVALARRHHSCTTLALILCDSAAPATDAPG